MTSRFWTNLKNLFYFLVILAMIPLLIPVAVVFVLLGVLDWAFEPLGPTEPPTTPGVPAQFPPTQEPD